MCSSANYRLWLALGWKIIQVWREVPQKAQLVAKVGVARQAQLCFFANSCLMLSDCSSLYLFKSTQSSLVNVSLLPLNQQRLTPSQSPYFEKPHVYEILYENMQESTASLSAFSSTSASASASTSSFLSFGANSHLILSYCSSVYPWHRGSRPRFDRFPSPYEGVVSIFLCKLS
jgi:hypothetical protein